MSDIPEVQSVMTLMPHSVGPDQTLAAAREIMAVNDIRHLPVRDGGQLKGVISDRDINFALAMDLAEPEALMVRDIFTEEPFVVEPTTKIDVIAERLVSDRIGSALVVVDGKVVGIFTTIDACRVLTDVLRKDATS